LLWLARRVIFPVPVILNRFTAVLFVLIFGIFLLGSWLRDEHHDHHSAIKGRRTFDRCKVHDRLRKLVQLLSAQFGVRDLASLEDARDFDLVALFQEASSLSHTRQQVMLGDTRTDLYTLNFLLLALLVLTQLPFEVFVLTVVDNLAHGGLGGRRDHHQIEPLLSGGTQGLTALHDAQLSTIGIDDSNISEAQNALVYGRARIWAGVSSKSCYLLSPQLRTRNV
jgi:hypothetical protein